jgi:hypothetical protein
MLDQVVHIATLCVVLNLALPAQQVWSLAASPAAHLALYASAYIVAACATPIAAMIWLDPGAKNAALSGGARLRSLCAGAAMVSLALFAGILALPAALVGYAFASRHPLSTHPLDRPAGLLSIMVVAATLGAVLTLIR